MMKRDIENLKMQLNGIVVRSLLLHLGYKVDRQGKFKLRHEERTASASVRVDGYIKDFGSGWGGDIFSLLQEYHGLTFPEAVEYVELCLGGV